MGRPARDTNASPISNGPGPLTEDTASRAHRTIPFNNDPTRDDDSQCTPHHRSVRDELWRHQCDRFSRHGEADVLTIVTTA
jgi:hypothetical protein